MNFLFDTLALIALFQYPVLSINSNSTENFNLYDTTIANNHVVSYQNNWQEDNQTGQPRDFSIEFYYGANSFTEYIMHVTVDRSADDVIDNDPYWSYTIYTSLIFEWGEFDFGTYYPSFNTIITFSDYANQKSFVVNDYFTSRIFSISLVSDVSTLFLPDDPDYIETSFMDNFSISCTFIMDSEYVYNQGYQQGRLDTLNNTQWRLDNYLFAIADIPFYVMRNFFNDSLFGGPSLFIILMSLVTLGIVLTLVKKFL